MKRSYLVYGEDVSSIRDGFTAWVQSDPETILRRHIVDVTRAYAAFREAPARKHSPSCQGYHFNKDISNRLTEQTRPSVKNWNPGPRRGKGGAIERHVAGKWHARFLDESLPCDTLWRLCGLVQQGYLLFGHQGLVNLSPRHQGLRTGQDIRRRIRVGNTRCRLKSSLSSATAQRPKILHGHVSPHQQQLCQKAWNREEASPHHPRHYAGRARGPGRW